ncbi:MAG: hypothetical protein Q4C85_02825 [Actinomyces sp.]|uniref:hypothetical protein n=1 Tax=Actinomyces sp. TaxID=29317 RepID=UPI0026DD4603|nr:hypothetical protein [Actinomyces sp.]MDO4242689.1 hypothetical protein [Actinomyces sp.]
MSDAANIVPAVLLGTTALGVAVGAVVGVSRAIADLYPDAPRVAHASATTWRSYCTDWDRRAVLISMAAVGVACLTSVGVWSLAPVPPDGGQLVPVAVLVAGVCVLAGSAALLCLAMALADRPQRAHCDLELAWEDALRSTAVRGLLDVAVGIGLVAVLGVLATSTTWLVDPEVRARGMGLTAALSVAAFAVGVLCWAAALVPWQLGRRVRNPSLVLWRGHDFADAMLRAGAC